MKNIQYKYLDVNEMESKTFNTLVPRCLNFDESIKVYYNKSKVYIGPTDDSWSQMIYVNGTYYHTQMSLPEYEGNIYMTPVELTDEKQLKAAETRIRINDERDKERRMLISAIRGTTPSYDLMDAFTTLKLGSYIGGFVDKWKWDHADSFKDITIEELKLMWDDLDMCWEKAKLKQTELNK